MPVFKKWVCIIDWISNNGKGLENTSKPSADDDPFISLNDQFRKIYQNTKVITMQDKVNKCVIVHQGDEIIFFTNGSRTKTSKSIPTVYHDLKTICHIAFSIYLILDPYTHRRTTRFPISELESFLPSILRVRKALPERFTKPQLGMNLLPIQIKIVDICLDFYRTIVASQHVNREDLVQFCQLTTPYIRENMR